MHNPANGSHMHCKALVFLRCGRGRPRVEGRQCSLQRFLAPATHCREDCRLTTRDQCNRSQGNKSTHTHIPLHSPVAQAATPGGAPTPHSHGLTPSLVASKALQSRDDTSTSSPHTPAQPFTQLIDGLDGSAATREGAEIMGEQPHAGELGLRRGLLHQCSKDEGDVL